eukprot:3766784-Amphidinium_carterae.2
MVKTYISPCQRSSTCHTAPGSRCTCMTLPQHLTIDKDHLDSPPVLEHFLRTSESFGVEKTAPDRST